MKWSFFIIIWNFFYWQNHQKKIVILCKKVYWITSKWIYSNTTHFHLLFTVRKYQQNIFLNLKIRQTNMQKRNFKFELFSIDSIQLFCFFVFVENNKIIHNFHWFWFRKIDFYQFSYHFRRTNMIQIICITFEKLIFYNFLIFHFVKFDFLRNTKIFIHFVLISRHFFYFTSFHFTSFHFVKFDFLKNTKIFIHFVLFSRHFFNFTSFYFISFHFNLFISFHHLFYFFDLFSIIVNCAPSFSTIIKLICWI